MDATGGWLEPESRKRRILIGLGVYVACLVVFAILAGDRLTGHTPYNHYALQADAWIHGRHDLAAGPPGYAGGNDFAKFENRWYISFPPFPAVLMLPLVWASGSAENFRDGQFIVWLAGIGPAVLFLVLEKLRRTKRSPRTEKENIFLSLLFAVGTCYCFTAVQGTVWFAAHVVGVALCALFVLFALDAERPVLAGAMLGLIFLTRPTMILVGGFYVLELIRVSSKDPDQPFASIKANTLSRDRIVNSVARFAFPTALCLLFAGWLNHERFHTWNPSAMGHEYLQVGWADRIHRWGLFSFHFLSRNLAVTLASIPWTPLKGEAAAAPFQISGHGLALWFTTPFYFWLFRPAQKTWVWLAALAGAIGPLAMNLLYQNSGWVQFAYRFSNDYAILLFVMLAVGMPKISRVFLAAAAWAVGWNLFGAVSFDRAAYQAYYSHDPNVIYPRE